MSPNLRASSYGSSAKFAGASRLPVESVKRVLGGASESGSAPTVEPLCPGRNGPSASRQGRLKIAQRFIAGASDGGREQSRQGRKTLRPTYRNRVRSDMSGPTPSSLSSLPGLRRDVPKMSHRQKRRTIVGLSLPGRRSSGPGRPLCQRVSSHDPRPKSHHPPVRPSSDHLRTVSRSPIWPPMATLDGQREFGESLVVASWKEINHPLIQRRSR